MIFNFCNSNYSSSYIADSLCFLSEWHFCCFQHFQLLFKCFDFVLASEFLKFTWTPLKSSKDFNAKLPRNFFASCEWLPHALNIREKLKKEFFVLSLAWNRLQQAEETREKPENEKKLEECALCVEQFQHETDDDWRFSRQWKWKLNKCE